MISSNECCAMRGRPEALLVNDCTLGSQFPNPEALQAPRSSHEVLPANATPVAGRLPDDFFLRIAEYYMNDPPIARRITDDRTSPLIWGEARSMRFLFLQMCVRDRWERCREIWSMLSEFERREYNSVYHFGPPSRDFFLDIAINDEDTWKDMSDCGSSVAGSSASATTNVSFISRGSRQ